MSVAVSGWAIEALVASTLLMIGVSIVRTPVRRLFGPQIAYALWALPALRMILPPMPQGWQTIATPMSRAGETIAVYVIEPGHSAVVASVPDPSLGLVAGALWGAGASTFLLWHLVQHRRFCARMLGTAELLDDRQGVCVIASVAAPGPLAFGVVRRYVAFPADFAERYDADERALALAHELGHHQRGDLIANWTALVVLALHWFNPIAWRAFRSFRADQELANDARVLAGRSAVDRHIYACAIVKAAHGGAVSAACHLHTITDLKGRLRMLTTSRTSRRRLATGAASVVALVAAGLGLTASGTRAGAALASIRTDIQERVAAVPPVPPAPPAGGDRRNVRRVVVVKDGKTDVYEGPEADRYIAADTVPVPPVPSRPPAGIVPQAPSIPIPPVPVTAGDCGPDASMKTFTTTRREGDANVWVICTDRIQAAAQAGRLAGADQEAIQREAMTGALASLRATRIAMLTTAMIPAADQAKALADIESSIKELEGEIRDIGKD